MNHWYWRIGVALMLDVHVQPGAARTEVAGLHDGRLKLRLAARATDGRANAALVAFIADRLGVSKRDVSIESGLHSRRKRVRVIAPDRAPETLLGAAPAKT